MEHVQESVVHKQHVLSNADLPGMFHGGGIRLICRMPSDRAAVMLCRPAARCPGAISPGFYFPDPERKTAA